MKITFAFILLFISQISFSQNSLVSGGGEGSGSGGSVSFSMGQVGFQPFENSLLKISPGVQQPFELFLLSFDEAMYSSDKFKAFPNPAYELINLETPLTGEINFLVFDEQGKSVASGKSNESTFSFHCKNLPSGIYTMSLDNTSGNPTIIKFVKR